MGQASDFARDGSKMHRKNFNGGDLGNTERKGLSSGNDSRSMSTTSNGNSEIEGESVTETRLGV